MVVIVVEGNRFMRIGCKGRCSSSRNRVTAGGHGVKIGEGMHSVVRKGVLVQLRRVAYSCYIEKGCVCRRCFGALFRYEMRVVVVEKHR